MIVKQELISKIKDYFDLNVYETKVWLALLGKGIASAGEVADISGVPRSRAYDVLESLEKRGFAIVKIGKPVKYIAVKPTEVLEKLKSKTMQDAQEKFKFLTNLKDTQEYIELNQLHNSGISPIKIHELTASLQGRSNIVARLRELIQGAKKEVLIATSALDFEDKSRVILPALEQAIKNNIKVKLSLSGSPEKIKKVCARCSVKPKIIDSPTRAYIADKSETLIMLTSESAEDEIGVWLNSPFFAESLTGMINGPREIKK